MGLIFDAAKKSTTSPILRRAPVQPIADSNSSLIASCPSKCTFRAVRMAALCFLREYRFQFLLRDSLGSSISLSLGDVHSYVERLLAQLLLLTVAMSGCKTRIAAETDHDWKSASCTKILFDLLSYYPSCVQLNLLRYTQTQVLPSAAIPSASRYHELFNLFSHPKQLICSPLSIDCALLRHRWWWRLLRSAWGRWRWRGSLRQRCAVATIG